MKAFKRILRAEDDPKDVELTISGLGEYNLANDIRVVRDDVEALDYLYRRGAFVQDPNGNPVVIPLDLKMPKLDGIQVLKQIKSSRSEAWASSGHCSSNLPRTTQERRDYYGW